jgi:hypothetical protein
MRAYLVGEGPHDIGDLAAAPPYRRNRPGFIQPIVEKVVGSDVSFDGQKVSLLGKVRVTTLRQALARKAFVAALLAEDAGSDLLVFVMDLDRGTGTGSRAAAADIEKRRAAIRSGCEAGAGGGLGCAAAVPCRTIEAWALADRAAIASLLDSSDPVVLPENKKPEDLWGQPRKTGSKHPKVVLAQILGRQASRADLSEIAERADIKRLRESCPLSFEPFASDLEAAA